MRARKRFGQRFLEPAWVAKLVAVIDPRPEQTFLEIGPAGGAHKALARARPLVAVEIDRDLAAALPERVPGTVRVVEGDSGRRLAALLRRAPSGARRRQPALQRGHADSGQASRVEPRAALRRRHGDAAEGGRRAGRGGSGSSDYGPLALAVALDADAEIVLPPAGRVRPPPKVTSAVVRLLPPGGRGRDRAAFMRLVRGAFQQRRKTILNALERPAATLGCDAADLLARAGVDPRIRPGDLPLEGFAALSRAVL